MAPTTTSSYRVVDGAGNEPLGFAQVVHSWAGTEFGLHDIRLGHEVPESRFPSELDGFRGGRVNASRRFWRLLPSLAAQQMRVARAFLSYAEVFVEVDNAVGAEIDTVPATGAVRRVDNDQNVVSLVQGTLYRAGCHAWRIVAVYTKEGNVVS